MISERLYRVLLLAYPREHRREYGEPMVHQVGVWVDDHNGV